MRSMIVPWYILKDHFIGPFEIGVTFIRLTTLLALHGNIHFCSWFFWDWGYIIDNYTIRISKSFSTMEHTGRKFLVVANTICWGLDQLRIIRCWSIFPWLFDLLCIVIHFPIAHVNFKLSYSRYHFHFFQIHTLSPKIWTPFLFYSTSCIYL
jgi:hypothetical protein